MYALEIQIERAQLLPRKHAQLMKEINRGVMERQATERLPNHFEESAYGEYGARRRQAKYTKHKLRDKGHKKPNVNTGQLLASLRTKITATQYGAKLTIKASLKQQQEAADKSKRKKKPRIRRLADWQKREIAVLSKKEIAEERKRSASEYKRGATSDKYKRKRKKRMK